MIVHKTNVMRVHFELFMDISIVDEHGLRLHNCQLILWPKSLCQSCTGINIKCQQGQENAILIRDQWFTSILNMSDNVLLTNLNPIFNKFGYTFDDFWPIFHGVGCARFRIPIREHTFGILTLTSHEYTILQTPIRGCA